jgi:Protein of unknown function (DUF642)/PEP-CTERM motif
MKFLRVIILKKLLIASALSLGMAASASAATVVFSENWDSYNPLVPSPNEYLNYANGSILGAWTLNDVDLIRVPNYGAISGISLDLNGFNPGSISRNFSTVVGQVYKLTFDRSFNEPAPFKVQFGSTPATYSAGNVSPNTVFFTGNGNVATLTFSSTGIAPPSNGAGGSVIDNIVVTAVPEPGEWAMMMAGLGVVGLIARRRRAKLT